MTTPTAPGTNAHLGIGSNAVSSLADLGGLDKKVSSVRVIWATETSQPMTGSCASPGTMLLETAAAAFPFQTDGNVVLYNKRGDGWHPTWATNTSNTSERSFCTQGDDNLVLYGTSGSVSWASGSNSPAGRLVLQVDCNLVVYDGNGVARWASNTICW